MTNLAKIKKTTHTNDFPPGGEILFSKLGYNPTVANSVLTGSGYTSQISPLLPTRMIAANIILRG